MAGGKETPRQKMIGMMYLVLTALLALQVSNAVLEKFAIINETLGTMVIEATGKNQSQLAGIVEDGSKSSNPKVKSAVDRAQKVRKLTDETAAYLSGLKEQIMKTSGVTEVDEKFINDHSSKVAYMLIDPRSPVGKNFEAKLNDYSKTLNELTEGRAEKFPSLARAPKDIPIFAKDPDHVRKSFLEFTFENTPPIAALASVTQIETEMLEYEALALDYLASEAGASVKKFDVVVPMVRAKSNVVAAGAPYEADLFMAASSSALSPTMTVDGKSLNVEKDVTGIMMGRVKFTASGGAYDPKTLTAKKTFVAKIALPDTTYTQNVEYFVAKPVIRVTTGNLPTLFMGCGNLVNFEVPALGTNYNPTFSGNGAEIIRGSKAGEVTIVPSQRKVTIVVNNAGTRLGDEQFDVRLIPRPRIVAKDNNGRDIDLKNGVRAGQIAGLRINAEANEILKESCPKDANYRIRGMSIILARGTARVQEMTMTTESVDLTAWRAQMRPGDRIIVEPKTVVRMTFKGTPEQVVVSGQDIINIPVQ
jgi:gliding motility-associated protein GldM